jgi:fermentation-respiration switch protein FrsA (DUF1100 family)
LRFLVACTLASVVLGAAAVSFRTFSMLAWLERAFLYFPTQDTAQPLSAFGPGASDVRFGTENRLHGVFVPAPVGTEAARITIVFCHGNGGNLTHRAPLMARLHADLGVNVFIFDYQGYGQSAGVPSEAATSDDARAAVAYLRTRPDIDSSRIVYYGESLGGAVAIRLAQEQPPLGLIVQSSFTSVADMARLHYPMLGFLLPALASRYESAKAISSIHAPVLIIHGETDSLVPAEHGRLLHAAANNPKQLMIVPAAGHNDVILQGGPQLWQTLRDYLSTLPAQTA